MPIKILLADRSITIQKVVEMLFSGKDYEVSCVSDGEAALAEAGRAAPDVVLVDIDLPRLDGYSLAGRMKQVPSLSQTPVILMMSRDDVFDDGKAKQVSITEHIVKPFESQELIGKVKKAVAAASTRMPEPPAAAPPAAPVPKSTPVPSQKPKSPAPPDIFDIIEEAPTQEDIIQKPVSFGFEEESIYEVEPVVEIEEQPQEEAKILPVGKKAVEEMRESLGLAKTGKQAEQEIVSFESLDMAMMAAREYAPQKEEEPVAEAREWTPPTASEEPAVPLAPAAISQSDLWDMTEAVVSKMAKEMFAKMPVMQPPSIADEKLQRMVEEAVAKSVAGIVREMAGAIVEKVAWEVVPDLAVNMIRAEIERLKNSNNLQRKTSS